MQGAGFELGIERSVFIPRCRDPDCPFCGGADMMVPDQVVDQRNSPGTAKIADIAVSLAINNAFSASPPENGFER
jgi:hypothetical protein